MCLLNSSTSTGRPTKTFSELSDRSKRRNIKHLRETTSSEELIYAAKSTLYVEGKRAAPHVVSQISEFSPQRAIKIRKMYTNTKSYLTVYTEDEVLAFMVDTRMTKNSYHLTRLGAKKHGADIYPSYNRIRLAKDRCYPKNPNTPNTCVGCVWLCFLSYEKCTQILSPT